MDSLPKNGCYTLSKSFSRALTVEAGHCAPFLSAAARAATVSMACTARSTVVFAANDATVACPVWPLPLPLPLKSSRFPKHRVELRRSGTGSSGVKGFGDACR